MIVRHVMCYSFIHLYKIYVSFDAWGDILIEIEGLYFRVFCFVVMYDGGQRQWLDKKGE